MFSDQIPIYRGITIKSLTIRLHNTGGRNNYGRITSYHKGKISRRYRILDLRRHFFDIGARVLRFERDPGRTAPIVLLSYSNGVLSYILAPKHLHYYSTIMSGYTAPISPRQ